PTGRPSRSTRSLSNFSGSSATSSRITGRTSCLTLSSATTTMCTQQHSRLPSCLILVSTHGWALSCGEASPRMRQWPTLLTRCRWHRRRPKQPWMSGSRLPGPRTSSSARKITLPIMPPWHLLDQHMAESPSSLSL
ncbi:hypothetical protein DXG03_001518, partial [Asterophora parasitica]